jgi:DNA-binding IclR family transcriptional regulator
VPSPAVVRAAEVLHHLAAHPRQRFTVSELAHALELPRATCNTVLLGLSLGGLVQRDPSLRYELAPACIVVGEAARAGRPALQGAASQAEKLARALSSATAVTILDRGEIRIAHVFDFGPPFGFRLRVGEVMGLVPPFGATFVAWEGAVAIRAWLQRAEPPLTGPETARYLAALDAVQRRGFSVTVVTARQPQLIDALQRFADQGDVDETRRARDHAVSQMTHSEYLAADIDPNALVRVAQVSAPVFDSDGDVVATIMLLGPAHDVTATELATLGRRVVQAATGASAGNNSLESLEGLGTRRSRQ